MRGVSHGALLTHVRTCPIMPISLMCLWCCHAAVRMEHGPDLADEVVEGLVLMRERAQALAQAHALAQASVPQPVLGLGPLTAPASRAAVVWGCPVCEQRFTSSRDYLAHVELFHEELALQVSLNQGLDAAGIDLAVIEELARRRLYTTGAHLYCNVPMLYLAVGVNASHNEADL